MRGLVCVPVCVCLRVCMRSCDEAHAVFCVGWMSAERPSAGSVLANANN